MIKKIVVKKKCFGQRGNLSATKNQVQKNLGGPKQISGPKKFWSEKISCPKNVKCLCQYLQQLKYR